MQHSKLTQKGLYSFSTKNFISWFVSNSPINKIEKTMGIFLNASNIIIAKEQR